MQHPITGGYRISQLERCTVAMLSRKTWRELRRPDPYLNGNTKWQEMPIVAFFFRNGFVDAEAGRDMGYYNTNNVRGTHIKDRLNKTNTQSLLSFGTKLMISGLLKRNWAWILDPERFATSTQARNKTYSKNRKVFSKAIVNQAIMKYGLNKVCFKLRVDMKVITFWRDYGDIAPADNGIAAPPIPHT
jgi:hypothetical protein